MRVERIRSSGPFVRTASGELVVFQSWGYKIIQTVAYGPFVTNVPASQEIIDTKLVHPPSPTPPINWKKHQEFNPVSNIKYSDELLPATGNVKYSTRWVTANKRYVLDGYRTEDRYTMNVEYIAYSGGAPSLPELPPISGNSLKDAFINLQPSFKDAKVNGINIYTAILELADLKKTFTKTAWTIKKSFSEIPEKHLMINFGVLPLFGDIQAMYHIVTRLSSYIDMWNKAALKGATWDKHVNLYSSDTADLFEDELSSISTGCQSFWRKGATQSITSGKAHLYFKPKFIGSSDRKGIFANALGLAEPIEGLWEAVPFSWAIDYFFQIGDVIAAWDEALPSAFRYDFVSAGFSYKHELKQSITYEMREEAPYGNPAYGLHYSHLLMDPVQRFITKSEYKRVPVSLRGMMDHMERPTDYSAGWNAGAKQASYLLAVAYLKGLK